MEANYSCPYGGMSIDFAFMNKIIELHAEDPHLLMNLGKIMDFEKLEKIKWK